MRCDHPTIKKEGTCRNEAVVINVEIPDDYSPKRRHTNTPDIARPVANLCRQHASKIRAHLEGTEIVAGGHEAQCSVCNHPKKADIEEIWCSWLMNKSEICREFGLSMSSLNAHITAANLWEKKAESRSTKKALIIAAEKGFAAGGHSAKTALAALRQLAKERGDVDRVELVDPGSRLLELSDDELADRAEEIARKLRGKKVIEAEARIE